MVNTKTASKKRASKKVKISQRDATYFLDKEELEWEAEGREPINSMPRPIMRRRKELKTNMALQEYFRKNHQKNEYSGQTFSCVRAAVTRLAGVESELHMPPARSQGSILANSVFNKHRVIWTMTSGAAGCKLGEDSENGAIVYENAHGVTTAIKTRRVYRKASCFHLFESRHALLLDGNISKSLAAIVHCVWMCKKCSPFLAQIFDETGDVYIPGWTEICHYFEWLLKYIRHRKPDEEFPPPPTYLIFMAGEDGDEFPEVEDAHKKIKRKLTSMGYERQVETEPTICTAPLWTPGEEEEGADDGSSESSQSTEESTDSEYVEELEEFIYKLKMPQRQSEESSDEDDLQYVGGDGDQLARYNIAKNMRLPTLFVDEVMAKMKSAPGVPRFEGMFSLDYVAHYPKSLERKITGTLPVIQILADSDHTHAVVVSWDREKGICLYDGRLDRENLQHMCPTIIGQIKAMFDHVLQDNNGDLYVDAHFSIIEQLDTWTCGHRAIILAAALINGLDPCNIWYNVNKCMDLLRKFEADRSAEIKWKQFSSLYTPIFPEKPNPGKRGKRKKGKGKKGKAQKRKAHEVRTVRIAIEARVKEVTVSKR